MEPDEAEGQTTSITKLHLSIVNVAFLLANVVTAIWFIATMSATIKDHATRLDKIENYQIERRRAADEYRARTDVKVADLTTRIAVLESENARFRNK